MNRTMLALLGLMVAVPPALAQSNPSGSKWSVVDFGARTSQADNSSQIAATCAAARSRGDQSIFVPAGAFAAASLSGAACAGISFTGPGTIAGAQAVQPDVLASLLPQSYVGEVATRAQMPTALLVGAQTGVQEALFRSGHITGQALTSFKVTFFNGYIKARVGEQGVGGPAQITASVEYPAGHFTQMTFGGSATGTVADKALLQSDTIYLPVPSGTVMWVWDHWHNTVGIPYYTVSAPSALGDEGAIGLTVPDGTMNGQITDLSVQAFPVAITAPTTNEADCLVGDSRPFGAASTNFGPRADSGDLARVIGRSAPYIKMASPGDTGFETLGNFAVRAQLGAYCSRLWDEFGINDIELGGQTAAQVVATRAAIAAYFPGKPAYGVTLLPHSTSTDNWLTVANQTVSAQNSIIQGFNTLERAGLSFETDMVDESDAIDPGRTGKWPVGATAAYYTVDGEHTNGASSLLIDRFGGWNNINLTRH